MNYFALIEMFLQAAPAEVELIKSIVDAIHGAHQTGQTPPTFVPVPAGAIPIQVPPAPPAPVQPIVAAPVQVFPSAPVQAPAPVVEAPAPVAEASAPQPVVVVGVPGQKRDRDLKTVAVVGTPTE